MDQVQERWIQRRLGDLKHRRWLKDNEETVPSRLIKKYTQFNINETNSHGESLLIGVVKYVVGQRKQVRQLNLLFRANADVNARCARRQQTALMIACQMRLHMVVDKLLDAPQINLRLVDNRGNNVLVYAVLSKDATVISLITNQLIKNYEFGAFRHKNCLGLTAERIAVKNGAYWACRMLAKSRVKMLEKMHMQLALIHLSARYKGWPTWTPYIATTKAAKLFSRNLSVRKQNLLKSVSSDSLLLSVYTQPAQPERLYLDSKQNMEQSALNDKQANQRSRSTVMRHGFEKPPHNRRCHSLSTFQDLLSDSDPDN